MLCNGCNRQIEDGSEFCEYCGKKVEKELKKMFCASCGKEVENNSLFCKHCGAAIGNVNTVPKKGNKYKKINFVVMIVLLVIVGLLVINHYTENINTETNGRKVVDGVVSDNDTSDDRYDSYDSDDTSTRNTNKATKVNGLYYTILDETLHISGEGDVDKKTINSFSKDKFNKVVFDSGNIDIPDDTFSGFSNIKEVELKNSVQKIGARAFKGCGFWMIAIGKSVTEIGEDAFVDCEISAVFLNNAEIRANLNERDDFGRLFEYASTIAVYYSTTQDADEDFTLDESGWGEYLKNNVEYSAMQKAGSKGRSLSMRNYNLWAHAIRPGFFYFNYTTGLEPKENILGTLEYDSETNTATIKN